MRLAWFSPMPPDSAPLADRDVSHDVIPLLTSRHDIEVFAASEAEAQSTRSWVVPIRNPYDFVWRTFHRPFDLIVYQVSNQPSHEYVWGYLWNYPGLVVMQERHLHQSRARVLLDRLEPRLGDYGRELQFNHGIDPASRGPLALFTGSTLQAWPMRRAVVVAARGVAAHDDVFAEELLAESPEASVTVIRPGVADPGRHRDLRAARAAADLRSRMGLPGDGIVLGLFGRVGRASRVPEILQALASLRTTHPNLFLLHAGPPTADFDLTAEARRRGLLDRVTLLEPLTQDTLGAFLGACDIALSLAWPPDANTAANWLRPLACGLPTIVTGRREYASVPLLDPSTWTLGRPAEPPSEDAIGVAVDLSSERESLQRAIGRLAADSALRRQLGDAGRGWWSRRHTLRHMADDYLAAIDRVSCRSAPLVAVPEHLRPDVFDHARQLAKAAGVSLPQELAPTGRDTRTE